MTDMITIRLPQADWQQIIDDYENYCGIPRADIETLQNIEYEGPYYHYHVCSDRKCWDRRNGH